MKTDFVITDKEVLDILMTRIMRLREKEWLHPADIEGSIKRIDDAWNEYKAKYAEYKEEYEKRLEPKKK